MTKLNPDAVGCKLFGDNLLSLLADIYHWIRGAAVAAVVILGILDFIKAVVANQRRNGKKGRFNIYKKNFVTCNFDYVTRFNRFCFSTYFWKIRSRKLFRKILKQVILPAFYFLFRNSFIII